MTGIDSEIFYKHSERDCENLVNKIRKTISANNVLAKAKAAFSMPVFVPVVA